jgi:hypothetical protein
MFVKAYESPFVKIRKCKVEKHIDVLKKTKHYQKNGWVCLLFMNREIVKNKSALTALRKNCINRFTSDDFAYVFSKA